MVKLSLAVIALLRTSDAVGIKNKFLVGDFDDDQQVIERVLVEKRNAAR